MTPMNATPPRCVERDPEPNPRSLMPRSLLRTFPRRWSLVLPLLAALLVPVARAQVQGVSYTASPVGMRVLFDGNAGLRDAWLYGGRLGFGFGEYVEIDGEYLLSEGARTDFGDFDAEGPAEALLAGLPDRDVALERYGANLRLNVGRSKLLPFLTAGTGVLRFKPDDVDDTRSIYVNYGGGVTLSLADRYTLTFAASRFAYRYSPFATFALGDDGADPDDFPLRTVYNTALTGTLRFYLGGRAPGSETDVDRALREQLGGGGLRLFVEPTYGFVAFDADLRDAGFPKEQPFAGVSAGVDLGPNVGLRGFYWRATDEDEPLDDGIPTEFRDLSLVGGELNLRFDAGVGLGLTPYLIVGGGYLNVGDDYDSGPFALTPDDRYFATGGLGVDVPLTNELRLKGSVRSLLMSSLDEQDVAAPSSVLNNYTYTVGVEFGFGGRGRSAGDAIARSERARADRLRGEFRDELRARDEARAEELARIEAELRALRADERAATDSTERAEIRERIEVRERQAVELEGDRAMPTSTPDGNAVVVPATNGRPRTLQIPIPEVGEVYIRFGDAPADETTMAAPIIVAPYGQAPAGTAAAPAAGLTDAQIRDAVRAAVRDEMDRQGGRALSSNEVEAAVRNAMDSRLDALAVRLSALEGRTTAPSTVTVVQPDGTTRTATPTTRPVNTQVPTTFVDRQLVGIYPYLGASFGDGGTQALIGLRGDYRRGTGGGARFTPEVALGTGLSLTALANVTVPVPLGRTNTLAPYVGFGAGLDTDAGLAVNLFVGSSVALGAGSGFVEYSSLALFEKNRVLVGYRIGF